MKLTGCFLLLCGWLIVIAALLLLVRQGERLSFVAAGMAIEIMGCALLARGYAALQTGALRVSSMQKDQA